jgi:hypothetical protein
MPNIEFHGTRNQLGFDARQFRAKIKAIFADWSCKDMVVDIIDSDVQDLQDNPQPYLRVLDTNAEEGERIAFRLRLEGYDVEFIHLTKFFSKSMYTLEEIQTELLFLSGSRENYDKAISQLLSVLPDMAISFLKAAILKECWREKPSTSELSVYHVSASCDQSHEAKRIRYVRLCQMLDILEGK